MIIDKFQGTLCSESDCKNNSVCRLQFENACGAWTTILLFLELTVENVQKAKKYIIELWEGQNERL